MVAGDRGRLGGGRDSYGDLMVYRQSLTRVGGAGGASGRGRICCSRAPGRRRPCQKKVREGEAWMMGQQNGQGLALLTGKVNERQQTWVQFVDASSVQ